MHRDEEIEIARDVGRIRLSKTSPLGAFVRRAQLEFTRLQLDDGIDLWKRFVVYRQSTLSDWQERNFGYTKNSFDANLVGRFDGRIQEILYGESETTRGKYANASIDDMDKLVEFQVDQMQSKYRLRSELYLALTSASNWLPIV